MEIKVLGHNIEVSEKVLTAPNNKHVLEYIQAIKKGRKLPIIKKLKHIRNNSRT